jgi:hypothetical protein
MNVLNGLLAAAVAAVAYFAVIPVLNPVVRISLPPVNQTAAFPGEKTAPPQNLSPVDYALISNQNLFHPERKIPPEKLPEKIIPKPDLFLYGTLISNDASFAFIEDRKAPHSTAGRGKRHVTLKKGDSVGGYILSEIEANRIVLVKGEDTVVVMLDDKEKRRAGAAARTAPGGTTPFQPAAASFPQAAPASAQAAVPSGPGAGGVIGSRLYVAPGGSALPQAAPSAPQAVTSSPATGKVTPQTTPTTRRALVEEMQKIRLESQKQGK